MHQYDNHFYHFLGSFAVRSAQQIVPLVRAVLSIKSVADFGCGQGAWLSVWKRAGASVMGIDGPYIAMQDLMIDADEFRAADLSQPIDLGRRFDLVQSLEVAEHLSARRATGFIEMLTAHGRLVLFSAAVPGQGGEHHVNEQPLEYWRREFRKQGYIAIDYIRPLAVSNARIQQWYRYNTVLYAEETYARDLPERVRERRVAEDQKLRNYWPFYHRMCQAAVRRLPRRAVDSLSRFRVRRQVRKISSAGLSY